MKTINKMNRLITKLTKNPLNILMGLIYLNIVDLNAQTPKYKASSPNKSLVLVMPSTLQSEVNYFEPAMSLKPTPEVLEKDTQVDIYPLPSSQKLVACTITVINPSQESIYKHELLPISTPLTPKTWPKVTLTLGNEGNYQIFATFLHKNGSKETASANVLVNGDAPRNSPLSPCAEASAQKYINENLDAQILGKIMGSLETQISENSEDSEDCKYHLQQTHTNFQPPYSQQEVFDTVKLFFSEGKQHSYSADKSAERTRLINLAQSLDDQNGARWIIQSLPLWNDIDDSSPAAQLANRASQLARPDDLALLTNLLECEINEGAKLWGLSILSNVSNPINTDFLQALVFEWGIQNKSQNPSEVRAIEDSAIEALSRMGSERAIIFLFDILEDKRSTSQTKQRVEDALICYLPASKETLKILESIPSNRQKTQASSKRLILTLLNNLKGQANENDMIED